MRNNGTLDIRNKLVVRKLMTRYIIIILTILLTACGTSSANKKKAVVNSLKIDTTTGLQVNGATAFGQLDNKDIIVDSLDSQSLAYIGEGKKVKFSPLIEVDVKKAKNEAILYIEDKVNTPKSRLKLKYSFEKYSKQYVGYQDESGNQFIYINGFCLENENLEKLKKTLLIVLDGGNCFFQMKIDKQTGKCIEFRINGVA